MKKLILSTMMIISVFISNAGNFTLKFLKSGITENCNLTLEGDVFKLQGPINQVNKNPFDLLGAIIITIYCPINADIESKMLPYTRTGSVCFSNGSKLNISGSADKSKLIASQQIEQLGELLKATDATNHYELSVVGSKNTIKYTLISSTNGDLKSVDFIYTFEGNINLDGVKYKVILDKVENLSTNNYINISYKRSFIF